MALPKGGPHFNAYHEYADGYFLSRAMIRWFSDAAQHGEIYALPLEATTKQFESFSPALIQVAKTTSCIATKPSPARNLDAAGVDDYGLLNAISQVPSIRDALRQARNRNSIPSGDPHGVIGRPPKNSLCKQLSP